MCASRMGLTPMVRAVDCAPALFVELARRQVDMVLADVALVAPDPARFVRAVRIRFPHTAVLLSGVADPRTAATVAAAGALGVLRAVSRGTDEILVAFSQALMFTRQNLAGLAVAAPRRRSQPTGATLTQREFQVLAAMSEGKSNAEIGGDLFISEETVKTHAKRMYRKLDARDRAHAVAIAMRRGLLP
ncbi:response regulator transcription factor [Glycomyces tenuis]|nr:response regulator transcription factor [Glycomyces tenuis]